jgi:group I intron endonuclease
LITIFQFLEASKIIVFQMAEYKIILYMATNTVNGKRYIGITKRGLKVRRQRHIWTAHSGYGSAFGAAIRKYGKDSFEFKVLVVCPDFDYSKKVEIAAIDRFKPEYNITAGGDGAVGFRHSEEHKAWISRHHKGKKFFLGKTLTDEHKERIRQARLSGKGGPKKGQVYNISPECSAEKSRRVRAYWAAWRLNKQNNSLTEG